MTVLHFLMLASIVSSRVSLMSTQAGAGAQHVSGCLYQRACKSREHTVLAWKCAMYLVVAASVQAIICNKGNT
jgi:hypothetical protein